MTGNYICQHISALLNLLSVSSSSAFPRKPQSRCYRFNVGGFTRHPLNKHKQATMCPLAKTLPRRTAVGTAQQYHLSTNMRPKLRLQGFSAWIATGVSHVEIYGVEESVDKKRISCYIPSREGQVSKPPNTTKCTRISILG